MVLTEMTRSIVALVVPVLAEECTYALGVELPEGHGE